MSTPLRGHRPDLVTSLPAASFGTYHVSGGSPLAQLYAEIHQFARPRDRGATALRPRVPVERALDGDIVLLAQGLANGTQRVTGFPYRRPEGLSPAGRRLDAYLEPLRYTIDHLEERRIYVYSTDLVPWYPGKHPSGKGDLRPTAAEVDLCWQWFEREMKLVKPRAVVLLGKWTTDRFLRRWGNERLAARGLSQIFGHLFSAKVAGRDIAAVAAYHPSAIWGRFEQPGQESWHRAVATLTPLLTAP